ncbi:hypothetical protein ACH5RR_018748 [Cinchona calisaya]|uniref:Beta-glucosidase n=1 Tax=Cinchona calisaya TaxID=153742 RepID=A0ABD2ZMT3_9GENT
MVVSGVNNYTRADFLAGFVFGVGTSVYQVKGAVFKDGKVPSTWDAFVRANSDYYNGATGDIACDEYHKYKVDISFLSRVF